MNAYEFMPKLPRDSSVASTVTHLVSAWFLVAAAAILLDPASPYTQRPVPAFRETITVTARAEQPTPAFRETVTVSARAERAPAVIQAGETITVVARRGDVRRGVSL